jgi:hypothetical protein
MAAPTNTHSTFTSIGNAEDVEDVIYNVDPTETPFLSALDKVSADAVYHEWQTQALASADTDNAVIEGNDAVTNAATPTVRMGNYCQISDKVASVTGTQQAIKKYGRENEMDYQIVLKGKELKRDIETTILQNQARSAGSAVAARYTGPVLSYIYTNDSLGATGASPTGQGTNSGTTTRTDGTQRAFTESLLKSVLQLCWTEGGNPDTIMLGGFNKQVMSSFVGRGTPMEDAKSKKIVATVDVYESDFGTLKVTPNRFMRSRDALVLEMDKWALGRLRPMSTYPLAKTGDSESKQMLTEYCLISRNEKASGLVADLTTS